MKCDVCGHPTDLTRHRESHYPGCAILRRVCVSFAVFEDEVVPVRPGLHALDLEAVFRAAPAIPDEAIFLHGQPATREDALRYIESKKQ